MVVSLKLNNVSQTSTNSTATQKSTHLHLDSKSSMLTNNSTSQNKITDLNKLRKQIEVLNEKLKSSINENEKIKGLYLDAKKSLHEIHETHEKHDKTLKHDVSQKAKLVAKLKLEINRLTQTIKTNKEIYDRDLEKLTKINVQIKKDLQQVNDKFNSKDKNFKNEIKMLTKENLKLKSEILSLKESISLLQKNNAVLKKSSPNAPRRIRSLKHQDDLSLQSHDSNNITQQLFTEHSLDDDADLFSTEAETKFALNFKQLENDLELRVDLIKRDLQKQFECLKDDLNKIRTRIVSQWRNLILMEKQKLQEEFNDFDNFDEIERKCIESEPLTTSYLQIFNSIKFEAASQTFTKSLIGEFKYPIFFDLNKIVDFKQFNTDSKGLTRCINIKSKIIFVDYITKEIRITNKSGEVLRAYNTSGLLSLPVSICYNLVDKKVYIGDIDRQEILVFDSSFNLIKSLTKGIVKSPFYMCYDTQGIIYVSDYEANSIYSFNENSGALELECQTDSPMHIKSSNNRLFVISFTKFERDENKLRAITSGSNCIFEIDKKTLKTIKSIVIDNWLSPQGLLLDDSQNILTTALLIDPQESNRISEFRYLFLINPLGYCLKTFELNIANISDFVFVEKRFVTCFKNEICIHKF